MQFDREEHKKLVEEMIKQTNFPGQIAELVVELKQAVERAEIKD
jgi:hypothetical protein